MCKFLDQKTSYTWNLPSTSYAKMNLNTPCWPTIVHALELLLSSLCSYTLHEDSTWLFSELISFYKALINGFYRVVFLAGKDSNLKKSGTDSTAVVRVMRYTTSCSGIVGFLESTRGKALPTLAFIHTESTWRYFRILHPFIVLYYIHFVFCRFYDLFRCC